MATIEELYERMPADARDRVDAITDGAMRRMCIDLWGCIKEDPPVHPKALERAEKDQDDLDEKLVAKAMDGDYGPDAQDSVRQLCQEMYQSRNRRAVLRAARVAVVKTRGNE